MSTDRLAKFITAGAIGFLGAIWLANLVSHPLDTAIGTLLGFGATVAMKWVIDISERRDRGE